MWTAPIQVTAVAAAPGGAFFTGSDSSEDASIKVWNEDGICERILRGHTHRINALALMGDRLVSASGDWTLRGDRSGNRKKWRNPAGAISRRQDLETAQRRRKSSTVLSAAQKVEEMRGEGGYHCRNGALGCPVHPDRVWLLIALSECTESATLLARLDDILQCGDSRMPTLRPSSSAAIR